MAKVNAWLLVNLGKFKNYQVATENTKTYCLGCEMLYIIEQRLSAQNIDKEKSAKGTNF